MPTITDSTTKSDKKIKNKDHKRKLQDQEQQQPEQEQAEAPKKDKKKKKKEKLEPETVNGNETSNGSEELSEKKKKKKQKKEEKEEVKEVNGGVDEVRESEDNVVVSGKDISDSKYKALNTFAESNLSDQLLECCKNFSKPSPIQSNSWPFLLHGRDFIGIAKTGSGKTLAFGIPAMNHILNKRKNKSNKKVTPLCLVLSPTRELAQQIYDVLSDAGKPSGVRSVCVYGGTSKGPQISALKSGVDIVIGTPGRLKDLIEMGVCQLQEVSFVVLDEADRMLDMGFEPEVRSILSKTSSVRQVVMFSATWPLAVNQLSQEFMDPNPVKVVVGSEDLAANHDVMQIVEVLEDRARDERLVTLLEKYHKSRRNRVLVFVLYKKEASRVENMLQRRGWKVVSISGDKQQKARTEALQLFKDGTSPLLIATDVAARGLDIPDVEVVINYSFPLTTEDYVHRIGRTGRAGKKGVAHTFFMKENKALSGELINVLREAGQNVPTNLLNFGTHVKKKESKLYGAHFKEISADAPKATKITFDSDNED
ncbi:putative RNA helicase [Helianthus annuus]|uniref:RNA helicase n=1 Tax=Helianthus annuus TaxID=4232 RepID=A0A9K3GSK0_HELAN|nr:DEAD-box ATP-dependent RNA helicase 5 [Helianthus annuus]KAF5753835.1 putative RNA helicase [Helianthus annuus]KAJ0431739.1 putative RNA helicase [Helianthus annuus]KAJ0811604.1 putative RNA helicase [Helianthus annuus]